MTKKIVFTRESGLRFTKIRIKTIAKNLKYIAIFSVGNKNHPGLGLMETTIAGDSTEECLEKTEKFLKTKLEEDEYIIL